MRVDEIPSWAVGINRSTPLVQEVPDTHKSLEIRGVKRAAPTRAVPERYALLRPAANPIRAIIRRQQEDVHPCRAIR